MRFILRAGGVSLITGAVCVALAAVPTAALAHPSVASVSRDVHAADAALAQVRHNARKHPGAARKALARNRAAALAAGRDAEAVGASGGASAAASALSLVAAQYDRDVRTFTTLLPSSPGSLQGLLAQALAPALAGRTLASGFLAQLIGQLPGSGAGDATSVLTNLLQSLPGEINSLAAFLKSGQLPQTLQGVISQAVTTVTGLLDAGLAQLQSLVPSLPAPAQAVVGNVLTQLKSLFGQLKGTLTQAAQTISSLLGGSLGQTLSGQLSQVVSFLQGFFGGSTGSTGSTGSNPLGGLFGSLPIPSFVSSLLNNLGFGGGMFFGAHAGAH
jgi:hypothetical protein